MTNDCIIAYRPAQDAAAFHSRFWRCHQLLHFIASRVLGGPERADDAVKNCWLRASRNPPEFEYEGAFRSWLLRVLIDEALAILRETKRMSKPEVSRLSAPVVVSSDRRQTKTTEANNEDRTY